MVWTGFQDSEADFIWTCSLVLVQSLQLFLHLTARGRREGEVEGAPASPDVVGDNNGAAAKSMTEVEDETAEM